MGKVVGWILNTVEGRKEGRKERRREGEREGLGFNSGLYTCKAGTLLLEPQVILDCLLSRW
jgi:hypothetical protein